MHLHYGVWTKRLISKKHKCIIRPFWTVSNKFCKYYNFAHITYQSDKRHLKWLQKRDVKRREKKTRIGHKWSRSSMANAIGVQFGNKEWLFSHCTMLKIKNRHQTGSVWLLRSLVWVDVRLGLLSAPYGAYGIIFIVDSKSFTTKTIGKLLLH